MAHPTGRQYDVIIVGVTGFSGSLLVNYFARRVDHDLKWAIAGRNESRLRKVRDWLGMEHRDLKIQVLDIRNEESVHTLAGMTGVLVTAIGPYDELGEPLVRACVEQGTDYIDITGEPLFVSRMRQKYHAKALDSGALLVHCCGFDSVPADVGTHLTVENLAGTGKKTVKCQVRLRGGISGGTWGSILNAFRKMAESPDAPKITDADPHIPWIQDAPHSDHCLLKLPTIDPFIVRASSQVHPHAYGAEFDYHHLLKLPSRSIAYGIIAGTIALKWLTQVTPLLKLLQYLRPPGTGPSIEERKAGGYQLRFFGRTPHTQIIVQLQGGQDAYTDTGVMASECAILLATRREELPTQSGITTPVGAFGRLLYVPLIAAGIRMNLIEARGRFRVRAQPKQES